MQEQVTLTCRKDWAPLIQAAVEIIPLVMEAGERQRIHDDMPTDSWKNPDTSRYMHHAFRHLVSCKTYEGTNGHPFVLADNTSLPEYWHALVDLLIIAVAELKKEPASGPVIDITDEE